MSGVQQPSQGRHATAGWSRQSADDMPRWQSCHLDGLLTSEGQLGQDEEIQLLDIGARQDSIGSVQVVVDVSHLGRELKTADAHGGQQLSTKAR